MKFRRKHLRPRAEKSGDNAAKPRRPRRLRRLRRLHLRPIGIPSIPLRTMAPNLVTMAAAACGIVSIILAQAGRWRAAIAALFCSGVCDFCDGGVARLLKASSKLGAELDSLADFVNFGVAPALITFYWIRPQIAGLPRGSLLHAILTPHVLVALAVFYAVACSFRLARFNTLLAEPTTPRWSRYFMGVPAPGGAYLLLTPLLLWIGFGERTGALRNPLLGAVLLLGVGMLMVSRVPTFALKHFHAGRKFAIVTAAILLASFVFVGFYETVGLVGVLYFATLPLFAIHGMRLPDQAGDDQAGDDQAAQTEPPAEETGPQDQAAETP